tara:strand:+ start:399 stop:2324 length:1926 start_codon:yes stop_codon:yes gene_type:complete
VSEAKERELNEVKGLAQRATVSERLKRHAEREVLELTRELETLRASTAAEREVTEERAREVREDAARQIEEMVTAMKRANESVETLRGRVAVLEKEEETAKTKNAALETELATLGKDLADARGALASTTESKNRLDEDLVEARAEMARLRDELEKTTASNASNERELREMRRKNEAYRAAVHTARGNDSAARAMMRDSVLTLNRMEDAAHARDVQILKEKHAAEIERMHDEFAVALADAKLNAGAIAHSTVGENQRVKRSMKETEEDAREAVRSARRREAEAVAERDALRKELEAKDARLKALIDKGAGKLNQATIRDAQAARLMASQSQAICRDLQRELNAEQESASAARHEASEAMHKFFAIRDKHEQRESLVIHQKETIQAMKRDIEVRDGEIDELKTRCKELKSSLRENEVSYLDREEVAHLNRIIADANARDRERSIELHRERERAENYAEQLEQCESKLCEESSKRLQLEHCARDVESAKSQADQDSLRVEAMSASAVLLEAEVLRLTRVNEQAEIRVAELEGRVERLTEQADALASSQNPNQSIRYLERLREERESAENDAEEAGKAVQDMKAALQFVACARRETRDKVIQYAREARKTGRVFVDAPGLPRGVSSTVWVRVVETVARLNLDAVE